MRCSLSLRADIRDMRCFAFSNSVLFAPSFPLPSPLQIRNTASDIGEDAREAWETSQNPWVYRISSVYDTLTAPDEFAIGVTELRR